MNPERSSKRDKFLCGCCAKTEEFNSDKAIFDYFGKEFVEYEYVIENLAIRPAPKKLLDLVPVHSTNISQKINTSQIGDSLQSSSSFIMSHNLIPAGEGDFQPKLNALKIRDAKDDFISFKSFSDDNQIKIGEHRIPKSQSSKPSDMRTAKDIAEMRQSIKSKEYRTAKQILSDLYEASEQSLNFNQANSRDIIKPIPMEIRDTIDMLKFKKALPNFYTRTEKKLFHTPGVYFADIERDSQSSTGNDRREASVRVLHENHDTRSQSFVVDSTVQTEVVSKDCPCPKDDKKNLKWKIIINKHSKS